MDAGFLAEDTSLHPEGGDSRLVLPTSSYDVAIYKTNINSFKKNSLTVRDLVFYYKPAIVQVEPLLGSDRRRSRQFSESRVVNAAYCDTKTPK